MIKERYISFETAKLAKEKGFNEPCKMYYNDKGEMKEGFVFHSNNAGLLPKIYCSVCTQSFLAKWLRDTYHLNISMEFKSGEWTYTICHEVFLGTRYLTHGTLDNYEEAMEEGLQESLKII